MTDWVTAAGVLLSGLVVGFMIVYSLWRSRPVPATDDLDQRDLESKRDALLRLLRESDAGSEERVRLEREAAEVLKKLESATPVVPLPLAGEGGAKRRLRAASSSTAGFLWGAGSMAALAALGFFVWQSTQERKGNDGLTGGGPPQVASPLPASDVQALEEKIRKDPNDLQARNDLAKAYFDSENLMAVFDQTQYVLERAPNDPRALTYQALVRTAMGQMDRARDMLQSATKSDPTFLDAWVSLAWVQMQMGRGDESRKAIDEGIKRHPEEQARLEQLFGQMKQRASGGGGAPATSPAPSAPSAASGPAIAITLNSSKTPPPNAVIFVIARAEGVTAGPPIAVKRIPATAFPISVQLSAADSMMGQELPPRVRIEARVDADGVATTKTPDDVSASQDGVAVGSSVSLTLR